MLSLVVLTGCVTSDLTGPDDAGGKAELRLFPMASSDLSMKCMIATINGRDVRELQSWRLTTEYLIPAGFHTYRVVCEESTGSIPMRDYSFNLEFATNVGGRYGLLRRRRGDGAACIVVTDLDTESEDVLAQYCPP